MSPLRVTGVEHRILVRDPFAYSSHPHGVVLKTANGCTCSTSRSDTKSAATLPATPYLATTSFAPATALN
jgi:hypothetical protein